MRYTKNLTIILSLLLFFAFITGCSKNGKENLGKAENKKPDNGKIITTAKWGNVPANQIIIVMNESAGESEAEKVASELGGAIVGKMEFIRLFQIENSNTDEKGLTESLDKAKKMQGVELAFPNATLYCSGFENSSCNPLDDDFYSGTNGAPYDLIGLKNAWDIIKASKIKMNKVQVGVNDEALGTKSEELGGSEIKGSSKDDIDTTTNRHHANGVVNIIGANAQNGGATGIASILGNKLSINVINTLDSPGKFMKDTTKDENDATRFTSSDGKTYLLKSLVDLQRQVESGSKVINCSFNFKPPSPNNAEIAKAMKKFLEKINSEHPDVIFVASAGNEGMGVDGSNDLFGQKIPNLVTVGATDENGVPASYSNYATGDGEITISACGKNQLDLGWNASGTSFSAPQVSGVVALMKSINPELTASEIKKILTETASKNIKGKDLPGTYGAGMLKADDAVLRVINDMRKKKNLPELKKEDLLNLSSIELKSSGGPEEFKVTASVKSVSEGGTTLEIEASGSNYAIAGDRKMTLTSPGSVSWNITYKEKNSKLSVKVRRLDTENCKVILLGGALKAEDLVGVWTGTVSYDDWSTPIEMAKKYIEKALRVKKGEPLQLEINASLVSENTLSFRMQAKGGLPMPEENFTFNEDGTLSAVFVHNMVAYNYTAKVTDAGDKLHLSGTWTSNATNGTMKMNGQWQASMPKRK